MNEFSWRTWLDKWLWTLIACALLLISGLALGYSYAKTQAASSVSDAQTAADVCESSSKTQQAVIDQLKRHAARNLRTLRAVQSVAAATMKNRDALQVQVTHLTRRKVQLLQELQHAHAHCTTSDRVVVCPDVADRLWPAIHAHDHPATSD